MRQGEVCRLALCVLIGLGHGILYIFLVLPWQHYDEPNHFEYAWLIANQAGLPDESSNDPQLNRMVVASMIRYDFFERAGLGNPDLESVGARMPFYSQKSDPPLYYLIASLPLRVLKDAPVEAQLYAMRFVSLCFYLLTIIFGWGITRELTAGGHALRWMVPLSMALLPGLVDIQTAANNDTAGIAMFTLFLWGSVRLLKERSWLNVIWVVNSAITCALVRSTTILALPFSGVVFLFSLTPRELQKWLWKVGAVAAVVFGMLAFRWGEAQFWYHQSGGDEGATVEAGDAIGGKRVFRVSNAGGKERIVQVLSGEDTFGRGYSSLTLAGWIWADQPVTIQTPKLHLRASGTEYGSEIHVQQTPTFFTLTIHPEGTVYRSWVSFEVIEAGNQSVTVYLDDLMLVEGEFGGKGVPKISEDGKTIEWDGRQFHNLLRNGGAEKQTFAPKQWLERLASRLLPDQGYNSLNLILYSVTDLAAFGMYYKGVLLQIFRTFWAKFGWGGLALVGGTPYRYLAILCLIGAFGAGWYGLKRRREIWWSETGIFTALTVFWGFMVMTRGANYVLWIKDYYPPARYILPLVVLILYWLNLGWYQWMHVVSRAIRLDAKILWIVYCGLWLYLDYRAIQALWLYRAGM